MITKLVRKIIGSRNDRLVKTHQKTVNKINQLEPEFQVLDDQALAAKTREFRQRLQAWRGAGQFIARSLCHRA